jgi:glycine/D-amino acid oxidase-like deaminating enzyme
MNLGEEHVVYGGLEIADRLGTDYYTRAIHTPGTVQINPFALLNGIVTSLPESISVYENSPVHTIDEDRPVRVRCDGGTVSAGRCLVTSNTHLRAFIGSSANLIPLMTFAAITKPIGPKQSVGRQDNSIWGVVPSSLFGTSMRRLGDDRLLVRNTYAFAADYNVPERIWARAQDRLRVSLQRRFPDAGNIEIEHTWGGLVSTFRDAKGFFGQIDKGIFAATASGMPVSILYGQQLAELVLGNDSETLGFVRRYSNPGRLLPDPWFGMFASSGLALQQIRACREI